MSLTNSQGFRPLPITIRTNKGNSNSSKIIIITKIIRGKISHRSLVKIEDKDLKGSLLHSVSSRLRQQFALEFLKLKTKIRQIKSRTTKIEDHNRKTMRIRTIKIRIRTSIISFNGSDRSTPWSIKTMCGSKEEAIGTSKIIECNSNIMKVATMHMLKVEVIGSPTISKVIIRIITEATIIKERPSSRTKDREEVSSSNRCSKTRT